MKYAVVIAACGSLAFGLVPAAVEAECPGADLPVTDAVAARGATACLVNEERAAAGAARLAGQEQLQASAQGYAERMVEGRFFAHSDPSGATFFDRLVASGYADSAFRVGGENLGWLGGAPTPRTMLAAWLTSPAHRANLLDPRFRETGVGVALGTSTGAGGATFVQHFGAREMPSGASGSRGAAQGGKRKSPAGKRHHRHGSRKNRAAGRS